MAAKVELVSYSLRREVVSDFISASAFSYSYIVPMILNHMIIQE